jgi:sugar phosphate permease
MKYRWELLLWLWLAFFLNQADRQIFAVVLPAIKQDLRLSDMQLGLVGSVFVAALAVTVPVAGFLGDVLSRKTIVVVSVLFWSLATLCTGFGSTLAYLLVIRSIASGVGEAFFAPSAFAMLSAEHQETRARALSLYQTSLYVGLVASGWIGGAIGGRFGWRAVFWVFGMAGLVLSAGLGNRIRERRAGGSLQQAAVRETLHAMVTVPTVRFVALACSALVFVNVAYLAWMPTYLYERFHLSLAQAGLASMLFHHAFAFPGVLIGGFVSDRLAPKRPQIRLELQAIALLAGAPFLFLVGRASSALAVYAALAGFGFFRGLYDSNTYPALYSVVAPRFHAGASGVLIAFSFLIASAAPVLLGAAKTTVGLSDAFSALSGVYIAGALLAFWGSHKHFLTDCGHPQKAQGAHA